MAAKSRRKKASTPKRNALTEDQRTDRMKARAALLGGIGTILLGVAAVLNTVWGKL